MVVDDPVSVDESGPVGPGLGELQQPGRLGKGSGYADIEIGLLTEAGLIDEQTVIATTVHDIQVLDHEVLPEEPHDFRLDLIVSRSRSSPQGSYRPRRGSSIRCYGENCFKWQSQAER